MALPTQAYYNLLEMLLNNSDWASDWNQNIAILKDCFRTFKFTITVQGSHTSPSTVTIQLQDATGTVNVQEQFYLRCRVANSAGYTNATNATIAAGAGTTLVETLTANKDLILQSDSTGKITLTCTDTTIESYLLLISQQNVLSPKFANYNNSQVVAHA